jgi:molecular chaperone GrpE
MSILKKSVKFSLNTYVNNTHKYNESFQKTIISTKMLKNTYLADKFNHYHNKCSLLVNDFNNLKKRKDIEFKKIIEKSHQEIIQHILVTIDDLDNALSMILNKKKRCINYNCTNLFDSIIDGFSFIVKKFISILKGYGLVSIEGIGKSFDPYVHEAINNIFDIGFKNNTIIEEYQKGYCFKKTLLRPSKVAVNVL